MLVILRSILFYLGFNKNELAEKVIDMFNEIYHDEFYRKSHSKQEFNLLSNMKNDSSEANIIIYLCMIKALAQIGMLGIAESFFQRIPSLFLADRRIQNALIDMWVCSNRFLFLFVFIYKKNV